MSRIVLDDASIAKIRGLTETVEVSDSAGNVVATIIPKIDLADYEELGPEISDDELVQRAKTERRYTTAEILEMLRGE